MLLLPDTAILPLDGWPRHGLWPVNLVELQLPGWLFQGAGISDMVASWPLGLSDLTIRQCRTCPLLTDRAKYLEVRAPSIRTLTLQDSHHIAGDLRLLRIFRVFPSLQNLSIPAEAISTGVPDLNSLDPPLETLELTRRETDEDPALSLFW